jgi:hypothetical protein
MSFIAYEATATITKLVTQLGKIPLHVQEESPLLKDSMESHAEFLEIGHVMFYTFTCPVLI